MADKKEQPIVLDRAELRIKEYLDDFCTKEEAFASKYDGSPESIRQCRIYIEEWVREQKRAMFNDEEIFGQAVHFFDEGLKPEGKIATSKIVSTGFSDEEIQNEKEKISEKRKKELVKRAEDEFLAEQKKKMSAAKPKKQPQEQTPKPQPKEKPKPQPKPKKESGPMILDLFAGLD